MEQRLEGNSNTIKIISIVTGVIISLTTIYVGFIKDTKVSENVNNQTVVQNLQYQIDRLTEQQAKQQKRIEALTTLYTDCGAVNTSLRIENEKLKLEYSLKGVFDSQKPYAEWTKSIDYILLDVNDKCLEWFFRPYGLSRKDVVGYDDYKNWSKGDADQFRKEDEEVLRTGKEVYSRDTVNINGTQLKLIVVRYPVYRNGKIEKLKGASFKVD